MRTVDVRKERLESLQSRAIKKAISENKEYGLSYRIVEDGELIEVDVDGNKRVLRKAKYGKVVRVTQKVYRLKR